MHWKWSTACSRPSRWAPCRFWYASLACWPVSAAIFMRPANGPSWACTGRFRMTCHLCGHVLPMTSPLLLPSEQGGVMSQFFQVHPENPQLRLIKQAVGILRDGGVIVYPTDSAYAVGCLLGDKSAVERIRRLRQLDDKHNFTLLCCDLSQLGVFAKVDTGAFRLLKAHTPGPYTFILNATREVPRMLLHPKRRTIGLRVPSHPIAQALLEEL